MDLSFTAEYSLTGTVTEPKEISPDQMVRAPMERFAVFFALFAFFAARFVPFRAGDLRLARLVAAMRHASSKE
jgi:hypothetical protein